jgi:hypothetical protein
LVYSQWKRNNNQKSKQSTKKSFPNLPRKYLLSPYLILASFTHLGDSGGPIILLGGRALLSS